MAEKPVVQVVLPPMPNPKDFSMAFGSPITDAAHYQMALNAWREAVQSVTARVAEPVAQAEPEPVPFPVAPDRTKN